MPLDHLVLLPVLIPFTGGTVALLVARYPRFQKYWTLLSIFFSLVSSTHLLLTVRHTGFPLVLQIGGWSAPFGITLIADLLSVFFVLMSQLVLVMGVLYATGSRDKCVKYPTFYPFFLFLATGLSGALLTGDIFNLFVFV